MKIQYINICGTQLEKIALRGKFIALKFIYLKRVKVSNNQSYHIKNIEKEEKSKIEQKKGNGKDMNRWIKLKRRKRNKTNEIKSFL